MSTRSWMFLALLLAFAIGANAAFEWNLHIFLGRKFIDAVEWLAFWR
ncbi:hypothetical protein [Tropicimonas sediminicola]|uniref:Uncharacterized protein n=1 Tax=Tropicimonas sediminicola TaxID=1031541 RepID=A0A239H4J9_9RHOB|nr:hypothetical protein [Tropicimonas sediminicola]SNS76132.1 hypothetical protein SAMN05421757_103240 [Tropicimonas sediminicola]